jgi:proteasome lid subunit RPN8/RPN11
MKFESDIKLILSDRILKELIECSRKATPIEACGLIFGEIKKIHISMGDYQIHYIGKQFYCLKSNIESRGSFVLINDPDKYFEIHQDAVEKKNLRLVSIFHSHPVSAYPSSIDIENMKFLDKNIGEKRNPFKNQIWTIMDMNNEELNGFIYFKKELLQIDLKIQET